MAPFFSIIIPTHNRADSLSNCLAAISRQKYEGNEVEIIVVEDGGASYVKLLQDSVRFQFPLFVVREDVCHGPAHARNLGAGRARGQYLVFLDDDCQPEPNWLKALAAAISREPNAAIGGRCLNGVHESLYAQVSQDLIEYLYSCWNSSQGPRFFTSNNFCLKRDLFLKLGGFDMNFPLPAAEDREFCDRLLHNKVDLVCESNALIFHHHNLCFVGFLKQHFNYGRGAYIYRRRRKNVYPLTTSFGFYISLLLYPFRQKKRGRCMRKALLLLLSQIMNFIGYLYQLLF